MTEEKMQITKENAYSCTTHDVERVAKAAGHGVDIVQVNGDIVHLSPLLVRLINELAAGDVLGQIEVAVQDRLADVDRVVADLMRGDDDTEGGGV